MFTALLALLLSASVVASAPIASVDQERWDKAVVEAVELIPPYTVRTPAEVAEATLQDTAAATTHAEAADIRLRAMFDHAENLARAGKHDAAIAALEELVGQTGNGHLLPAAYRAMGKVLLLQDERFEASAAFEQALLHSRDYPDRLEPFFYQLLFSEAANVIGKSKTELRSMVQQAPFEEHGLHWEQLVARYLLDDAAAIILIAHDDAGMTGLAQQEIERRRDQQLAWRHIPCEAWFFVGAKSAAAGDWAAAAEAYGRSVACDAPAFVWAQQLAQARLDQLVAR